MDHITKTLKLNNDVFEIKIFQNQINEIEFIRNKILKLVKINFDKKNPIMI